MFALRKSDETVSFAVPPTRDCRTGVASYPVAYALSEAPGNPKQAVVQLSRDIGHGMPSPYEQNTTNYTGDVENRQLPYP
jgi:hypothetical protein